jgi:hypothetical protein
MTLISTILATSGRQLLTLMTTLQTNKTWEVSSTKVEARSSFGNPLRGLQASWFS